MKRIIASVIIALVLVAVPCITAYASFTVTLRAEPPEGGTVTGGGTFPPGTNVEILATPNEGYTFIGWYRYGDTEPFSTNQSFTYEQESNRTYLARFEKAITIDTIAQPSEGGTVEQSGNGHYIFDESVTLTATPSDGYVFIGWFDNSSASEPVSTDPSYTLNVSDSMSFVARFSPQYTLSVEVTPEDTGTVAGNGTFAGGSIVTLEAIPYDDYRFIGWVSPSDPGTVLSTDASYTFNLDGNTTLTATFGRSIGYIWSQIALYGGIIAAVIAGLWLWLRHRRMAMGTVPASPPSGPKPRAAKRRFKWTPPWKRWFAKKK